MRKRLISSRGRFRSRPLTTQSAKSELTKGQMTSPSRHSSPDKGLASEHSDSLGLACPAASRTPEDRSKLERLYASYASQLSATLRRMYGDGPPDPDDVAQAAFFKVLERGDLDSIKNLKAFLWSTARNILRKEVRARTVRDRYIVDVEHIFFAPTGDVQSPERVIEARQQLNAINCALRTMPKRRRHAFILNRIDGLSVAAVGRDLGISRTAAAKHIARAMADLDACLNPEGEV